MGWCIRQAGRVGSALLFAACARGSADLSVFDASARPVGTGDAGADDDDAGDIVPEDGVSAGDGQDGEPELDCAHDGVNCPIDAGTDTGMGEPDASAEPDAGPPRTSLDTTFKVLQENGGLSAPVGTAITLTPGDVLRITASGYIWPGIFNQGCNGPGGTSGAHSGSQWPLSGGPDFSLIGHVNGAWNFVGTLRTLRVTQAGTLLLATNDDNTDTGDDCTSVGEAERGFTVRVELNPP